MFSLFPSQWNQPLPRGLKPIRNLADHHFPPKTVLISRPVPEPVKTPVKIQIPESEMCLGENNDFTLVDKMLAEIFDPAPEYRTNQILQMVQTVNQQIQTAITIIQNVSPYEDEKVSRKEILKLLQMFSNYSKTIEQYIKETIPSSF